jgi:hypothetical protein
MIAKHVIPQQSGLRGMIANTSFLNTEDVSDRLQVGQSSLQIPHDKSFDVRHGKVGNAKAVLQYY